VVIYETIVGRAPFQGDTTSDLIAAILKVNPQPLAHFLPYVPPDLQRILSKALRKDREERYQTVKDMLVDLRSLKKALEQPGAAVADEGGTADSGDRLSVTSPETVISPTSSAHYVLTELKRRRTATAVMLAVLFVGALATVYALRGFFNHRSSGVTYLNTRLKRITNTGKSHSPAISPDGKYVAYLTRDGDSQYLWISQVASLSKVEIGLLTKSYHNGLTFSSDGNQLYYVSKEQSDTAPTLYRIPTLGGPAQKVISGVDSTVSVSSDGDRLAFVRNDANESAVIVANADGSGEQNLTVRHDPDFFWAVAWSPDGRRLACAGMRRGDENADAKVIELDVASGRERPITNQRWSFIYQVAWLSDGSGLIMLASDKQGSKGQLWLLSYPSGEARRITTDLSNYSNLHLTADSTALVTTVNEQQMNLWTWGGEGPAKKITSGDDRRDGMYGLSWTPDGRIVYSSSQSGSQEIWIMEPDGSNQRQLTVGSAQTHSLTVSPDGRYIVYVSDRTGDRQIWRVNIDGSNPIQLTRGGGFAPYCSADSKWVFYMADKRMTWRVPIDGGDEVQLANAPAEVVGFSPDGKLMAYVDSESVTKKRIAILRSDGQPPIKFLDLPPSAWRIHWGPDSQALTYVDGIMKIPDIWNQPLEGGPPIKMTDFKGIGIAFFAWSRDGKQVAIAGRQSTSDVVLINEVK
jgi:TolB protein